MPARQGTSTQIRQSRPRSGQRQLISNRFAVKYNSLLANFFYGFAPFLGKPHFATATRLGSERDAKRLFKSSLHRNARPASFS
jgi:hypothetical protein